MTCDRCEDIHKAQRNGKTNQKCECDCHISYSTDSAFGQECTCGQNNITAQYCPVHGNTFLLDTSGGAFSGNVPFQFGPTLRLEPYLIQP